MTENAFGSLIESSRSILILLPTKPYFDQVAAGLALYLVLRESKETTIACPSPMLVEFNRLVGVNKVTSELGNKNLSIRFSDYKANDIEKVSYDIENGEFRLTVIPKSGFAAPKKEQTAFEYSGLSADTAILIGGANETHFPAVSSENLAETKLIHIGVRALSLGSGKEVISFANPASSVSEITATLINQSGFKLDADTATNLLMGIEEGSQEFKGPDVRPETFETVAQLLRAGGQRLSQGRIEKAALPADSFPVEEVEPEEKQETPKSWLEPKIYKGTSIS